MRTQYFFVGHSLALAPYFSSINVNNVHSYYHCLWKGLMRLLDYCQRGRDFWFNHCSPGVLGSTSPCFIIYPERNEALRWRIRYKGNILKLYSICPQTKEICQLLNILFCLIYGKIKKMGHSQLMFSQSLWKT